MKKNDMNDLVTPALLLNVDQMESNILDIVHFSKENDLDYRPHIKTHKSIEIAKRQIELGAVGITVAKVGEAEVMAAGGIDNILIAYPIAVQAKLARIKKILTKATIILTIDSKEQATIVNDYFKDHDQTISVWIKINSGLDRCGVEPNDQVVELAQHITKLSALKLTGIFTHAGHSYAANSQKQIENIANEEAEAVLKSTKLCEEAGIKITNRSIGSTPTFKQAGKIAGITEIRPGNAVFYDNIQVGLGVTARNTCALTVLATVVSIKEDRIVIDAGSKTLALDQGAHGNKSVQGHGYIKEYPDLIIERLSEEHGIIPIQEKLDISLNEQITIIPNHACTVVNLFDRYTLHQDEKVIGSWKVDARGRID